MSETTPLKKEIIPAVLPKNFDDLRDKMSRLAEQGATISLVQIDACDGRFVPSRSWPYLRDTVPSTGEADLEKHYLSIVNQAEGFPFWEKFDFEADLMVSDPQRTASEWVSMGAVRVIIHLKSAPEEIVIRTLQDVKARGAEAGIAVSIMTPVDQAVELIKKHRDLVDVVQCMGIEKIGYQGQSFDGRVIEKVAALRREFPDLPVSVDGGVTLDNAEALLGAGATRLVAGSAIFGGADSGEMTIKEAIRSFKDILEASL